MNAQTHYPEFVEEVRRLWQPYTQQNVDRMELRDLVLDMIETVKDQETENARQSAQLEVKAEANGYLRSMLDEAQRELGRKDLEVQQLNEQLAREVE